ncbi:MAG TPA: helicase [Deltaproteobacteria bacterium]|nr:MAG: hypothetical protein A2048_02345 [Deltaproteobacteria bacterium GWA2_45_12]HBF12997.1 helicase [Deltaproteobacteria bacterium]
MGDRRVVLDLETKKTFDEVGGREHIDQLGISVVGIYDYECSKYRTYEEKELGQLQNFLIDASLIIGFNHINFDFAVLQAYFSIDVETLPAFDILADFEKKAGHRIGLDSLAKATLNVGKTGHGLDAIRFYREGRMEELKSYCLNDVKVTRDIFEYGIENGKIFYFSKIGQQKKEMAVDWKQYKKPKIVNLASAQYKLF